MTNLGFDHQMAIVFVEPSREPDGVLNYCNSHLLGAAIQSEFLKPETYAKMLDNKSWRLVSIYKPDQELETLENDPSCFIHAWTFKGHVHANVSLTILSRPDAESDAFRPSAVIIPHHLIGRKIQRPTPENPKAEFNVVGLGWATRFSCCPSDQAVVFHSVFQSNGAIRSQTRFSLATKDGCRDSYSKNGLIQFAGPEVLHGMQHTFDRIARTGKRHCSSDVTMAEGLAKGTMAVVDGGRPPKLAR